jgi:acyl-CoA thioester hydrolase
LNPIGVEVWRGGVNAWDCDSMGHLNVRFYVAFAMEGLAGLAAELGMGPVFAPDAPSTLVVREHHIRYLREAREQAVLHMTAAVLDLGETDAHLVQVIYHSMSGEPCAAIQTRVSHVTARDARPFPWSAKVRERAKELTVELPDIAKARSLNPAPPSGMSLARAEALGLEAIGRGAILPPDCDAFGRMMAHHLIGHVADGITGMVTPFRQAVVDHSGEAAPARVGGAALEYRLVYLAWPRVGDRFVVRSGISGVDARVMKMTHWVLDPASGQPWGGAEASVTTFDLDRRKIVPISPAAQGVISSWIKPGLGLSEAGGD